MQIEQVIGGVDGNAMAQAIQFRMRTNGQEQFNKARLVAWNAEGESPVLLIDFTTNVPNGIMGGRVLVASSQFARYTDPPVEPDFVLTELIPAVYLTAGSLTFENDEGTLIVWRLGWGGGSYSGSTIGALTNDLDGEFGPTLSTPLPTSGLEAVLFQGAADALSTSNIGDYALSVGAAVFTNNAGAMFRIRELQCPGVSQGDPDPDRDGICADVDNCPDHPNAEQEDADADGAGDFCEACPDDPSKVEPGSCGCGISDADEDSDGVPDCHDNCATASNPDQSDVDEDEVGDSCGGCPSHAGVTDPGRCGCGISETDSDADTVPDCLDNCVDEPNTLQPDADNDGAGDACDLCPLNSRKLEPDEHGCDPAPAPRGLCGAGFLPLFSILLLLRAFDPSRVFRFQRRRSRGYAA